MFAGSDNRPLCVYKVESMGLSKRRDRFVIEDEVVRAHTPCCCTAFTRAIDGESRPLFCSWQGIQVFLGPLKISGQGPAKTQSYNNGC